MRILPLSVALLLSPLPAINADNLPVSIDQYIQANMVYADGTSPIFAAINQNDEKRVQELLRLGADINHQTPDKKTPLRLAIAKKNDAMIRLLIERGADLDDLVDENNNTALTLLWLEKPDLRRIIVSSLLKRNSNPDCIYSGFSLLYLACAYNEVDIARMLVHNGADVNMPISSGETPLFIAAQQNNPEIISFLLSVPNIQIDKTWHETGITPLYQASWIGNYECVDLLVKAGADVNCKRDSGETPLFIAAQNSREDIVSLLLTAPSIDINLSWGETGVTPLHQAAGVGSVACVQRLLDAGADYELQDVNGNTALHVASALNRLDVVQTLLSLDETKRSTDSSIAALKNNNGQSALTLAVEKNNADIVRLLMYFSSLDDIKENIHRANELEYDEIVYALSSHKIKMQKNA